MLPPFGVSTPEGGDGSEERFSNPQSPPVCSSLLFLIYFLNIFCFTIQNSFWTYKSKFNWLLFLTFHSDVPTLHPHFPKAMGDSGLILGWRKISSGKSKRKEKRKIIDDLESREIHINIWKTIAHPTQRQMLQVACLGYMWRRAQKVYEVEGNHRHWVSRNSSQTAPHMTAPQKAMCETGLTTEG